MRAFFMTYTTSWLPWWREQSPAAKAVPIACLALYTSIFALLGALKPAHLPILGVFTALYYAGPKPRTLFLFLLPFILTSLIYDSQHLFADQLRSWIRVSEPHDFDRTFFGIETAAGRLTPPEWWQLHLHPVLDFITGLAYILYIPVFLASATYLHFWLAKKNKNGTAEGTPLSLKVMWAFFWVNMVGYTTYYLYPAAPPWYVALHGFGPVDLQVAPNPAGCARFDALIGFPLHATFYAQSANVFSAIPSLHVAYPLVAVYFAFRFGTLRTFTTLFYLLICFSAVYLNHHYMIDILWGSSYAILSSVLVDILWGKFAILREKLTLRNLVVQRN